MRAAAIARCRATPAVGGVRRSACSANRPSVRCDCRCSVEIRRHIRVRSLRREREVPSAGERIIDHAGEEPVCALPILDRQLLVES